MNLQTNKKTYPEWTQNDMACVELDALKRKLKHTFRASPNLLEETLGDISRVQRMIRGGSYE
ncbi:MAG: hypothetical protein HQ515_03870 [Phycisphaeraceae bacterium]|nr:hypothetical protein [Phycisphaeraceae bacterium]